MSYNFISYLSNILVMYCIIAVHKKIIFSLSTFVLGILIYWANYRHILIKNNILSSFVRNCVPDTIWTISLYFLSTVFSKEITKNYIILSSIYVIIFGISFELLQFTGIVRGTDVTTSTSGGKAEANNLATYKLNDDIYIKSSSGEYRVKFTKIYETKERNQFSDKQANKVLVLEYEYENISMDSDLYVSDLGFKVYDKENNQLETYPVSTKYASNVSKGRKATASVAYALNSSNNYLDLEFYDNMFNSKPDCKVVFEW